jgi:hypothetical protein
MNCYGFQQIITLPTHRRGGLLDNFYTNIGSESTCVLVSHSTLFQLTTVTTCCFLDINNKDKTNFNLMFLKMLFIINKVNVKVPDLITLVNIVYCSKFHLGMAIQSSMWSL